jgi:hypothetical protein
MHAFEIILVFLGLAVLVAVMARWQHFRADRILKQWAQETGIEIVSAEKRYLRLGPFFVSTRGQFVFRIVVKDQAGMQRTGWLRVGGLITGVFSDRAEVKWDS